MAKETYDEMVRFRLNKKTKKALVKKQKQKYPHGYLSDYMREIVRKELK